MKYMGSKARHAKDILPIILKDRKQNQLYVEPFVGGANMIDKVTGVRYATDINEYLVAMWDNLCKGWVPPDYVEKDEYISVRENISQYPKHYVGWVAHCCAYNGKWFGGFAGKILTKEGNTRNYQAEAKRAVLNQVKGLIGTKFEHKSYSDVVLSECAVIYCDPPYKGTTKYKDDFDHDLFYKWCRRMRSDGHILFVSEYEMPGDFECIWSKEVTSSLTPDTGSKKAIQKLFTLR